MISTRTTRGGAHSGSLLIVLSAMLWGTVGVTTQAIYGLAETSPLSVAVLRLALALPALGVACAWLLGRRALRVERRHLALMLAMGAMLASSARAHAIGMKRSMTSPFRDLGVPGEAKDPAAVDPGTGDAGDSPVPSLTVITTAGSFASLMTTSSAIPHVPPFAAKKPAVIGPTSPAGAGA